MTTNAVAQLDTVYSSSAVSATTTYDYDAAGNRTAVNGAVYSYDQRNRLSSGGGINYSWTARGTLASTTGAGAASYSYDGLDRLRTAGSVTYTYDDLDRVLTRNGTGGFAYAGTETDPVTAGTESLLRSPTGQLLAIKRGATTVVAGIDRHGDLAWTLNPATATITDSRIVDPYGKALATTGTTSTLGFQADYSDPTTGNVWMAARWYNPTTGTFLSRDTYPGEIGAVLTLNRYSYGLGDPLRYWDPTGRFAVPAGCDNACQWQHYLDTGEIFSDHTYAENEDGTTNSGVSVYEDDKGNVTSVVSPTGVVSVSSSGSVDRSISTLPYTPNQQTADAIANLVSRGFSPEDIVAAIVPVPSTPGPSFDPMQLTFSALVSPISCAGSCQPPVVSDCSRGTSSVMCAPKPPTIDGPCTNVSFIRQIFAICDPNGGRKGPDIVCSAHVKCPGAVADKSNDKDCISESGCNGTVTPKPGNGTACMSIACDGTTAVGSTNCGAPTKTRSETCGERGPTIRTATPRTSTNNNNNNTNNTNNTNNKNDNATKPPADVDDLLGSLPKGDSKGGRVRVVGSDTELGEVFDDLTRGGTPVDRPGYPGQVVRRPDGTEVGLRDKSSAPSGGGRTIDIRTPGQKDRRIHIK